MRKIIRPKQEYIEVVSSSHKKKHSKKLERIQSITMRVLELKELRYEE